MRTFEVTVFVVACSLTIMRNSFAQVVQNPEPENWTGWSSLPYTPANVFNGVDASGDPTFNYTGQYRMIGVLLNTPGTLLNDTPDYTSDYEPYNLGGQWEIFFQAAPNATGGAAGDFGGTEAYLGQDYGNLPFIGDTSDNYTNAQWQAELTRVSYDANNPAGSANPEPLVAGDLIEVDANIGLYYAGQYNVNEAHSTSPNNQFYVHLIQANYGMPAAQVIKLSQIEAPSGVNDTSYSAAEGDSAYEQSQSNDFDPTRATGGEHYQGDWVELQDVHLVSGTLDGNPWAANGYYMIEDSSGLELPLELGNVDAFNTMAAPTGDFNVYGVFNQDSTDIGTNGYLISAVDPSDFTAVPEPAMCTIMAVGSALLLMRRRTRGHRHAS